LHRGLWVDFDSVSVIFVRRDSPFRYIREFPFQMTGGATIFAKLRSKIAKSPKIGEKDSAHHFVEIARRFK